jgi:hypothetical protein
MRRRSSLSDQLYLILNIIMILIYGGCGITLYFWQTSTIPTLSRKLFGGILLLYAIYRGFSLYRKTQSKADEN